MSVSGSLPKGNALHAGPLPYWYDIVLDVRRQGILSVSGDRHGLPGCIDRGSLAGKNGGAILLVDGTADKPSGSQFTVIWKATDLAILGGESAVSSAMKTAIDESLK